MAADSAANLNSVQMMTLKLRCFAFTQSSSLVLSVRKRYEIIMKPKALLPQLNSYRLGCRRRLAGLFDLGLGNLVENCISLWTFPLSSNAQSSETCSLAPPRWNQCLRSPRSVFSWTDVQRPPRARRTNPLHQLPRRWRRQSQVPVHCLPS